MTELYNKLEHLENLIIAMNQNGMKRLRLLIPKEYVYQDVEEAQERFEP